MAKISPVSIKYMIHAAFKAAGPLEKPDVIGAIFGQTEGLLGTELEMRELQKEGKIGRIEVDLEIVDGRSVGEIQVPTALDKTETTLVAAALETIDRIGPTEASIEIIKIEDVRGSKRDYILERAKKLLGTLEGGSFKEMSASLKEESRAEKIQEYGASRLPAGDLSGNELIVVEGRADVVNLLRNRVNNVIGMDGAKLPPEINELSREKELTVFVDGDRGGKLIATNVINHARVKYIASAPEGKEVEELTGKEILMSLRKRVPVEEFLGRSQSNSFSARAPERTDDPRMREKLSEVYDRIKGTRAALLLDSNLDIIKRVGAREVAKSMKMTRKPMFAVVVEGTATASLIRLCDEMNVSYLAATTFSDSVESNVKLISL